MGAGPTAAGAGASNRHYHVHEYQQGAHLTEVGRRAGLGLPAAVAAALPALQDLGLAGAAVGGVGPGCGSGAAAGGYMGGAAQGRGSFPAPALACTAIIEYEFDEEYCEGRGGVRASGAGGGRRRRVGLFGRIAAAVGTVLSVTAVAVGAVLVAAALNSNSGSETGCDGGGGAPAQAQGQEARRGEGRRQGRGRGRQGDVIPYMPQPSSQPSIMLGRG